MAKPNPVEFMQQVRQEANKVTWPTRKEVGISSLMVVIFMVVSAIFFFIADSIIRWGVQTLLSFGS
ncbi:preprotein translocase subunit SecE [Phreatobacter oligotrophus]|jgi:preprotein translocase subunit SecE|uniref:Protein translocase subunit SecE n=1 Tax=Phreatobacter oligotrophus TaxID=1122261 RepID=A0A2T4ZIX5_9HYPH|nr:preprotein translocase subunit SecE [Phreatobacter oligotrophus]MCZ8323385.1 preprotein translocase subunit SecE [Novosphingobium sp.]PTM61933.1 protein translocase subunit secE/sec61 gamma [Phreatobacter oligotrophus]